jgi:hypothetical protein
VGRLFIKGALWEGTWPKCIKGSPKNISIGSIVQGIGKMKGRGILFSRRNLK